MRQRRLLQLYTYTSYPAVPVARFRRPGRGSGGEGGRRDETRESGRGSPSPWPVHTVLTTDWREPPQLATNNHEPGCALPGDEFTDCIYNRESNSAADASRKAPRDPISSVLLTRTHTPCVSRPVWESLSPFRTRVDHPRFQHTRMLSGLFRAQVGYKRSTAPPSGEAGLC